MSLAVAFWATTATADRFAPLYSPFNGAALAADEQRFLKAALAFEGYYDGPLVSGWDRSSQTALDQYVADTHDEDGLVWHSSMLALKLSRRMERDGWEMRFLADQGQSVLVPVAVMEPEAPSAHFEHWRHTGNSLRLSLARAGVDETREFHNFAAAQNPDGSDTLVLREPTLAVTSARREDGSTLYVRSDLVQGLWSTVVVSAAELDQTDLQAIAVSIAPGEAGALFLPEDGTLTRMVSLAADLLQADGAFVTPTPPPGRLPGMNNGSGTGFVVSPEGHVLTNGHVVGACDAVAVDGAPARVISTSQSVDLALLQIAPDRVSGVARFSAAPAGLNADITVTGFPLNGLLTGLNVTRGSVSGAYGIGGDARNMQISAPVQSGNSGGPVLNAHGAVVGVVVSKLNAARIADRTGEIPQNINFAIRGAEAAAFLTANGIAPLVAADGQRLAPETLAEEALSFTTLVECL